MKLMLLIAISSMILSCVIIVHNEYPNYNYEKELLNINEMIDNKEFGKALDKAKEIYKEIDKIYDRNKTIYDKCVKHYKNNKKCMRYYEVKEQYEKYLVEYDTVINRIQAIGTLGSCLNIQKMSSKRN